MIEDLGKSDLCCNKRMELKAVCGVAHVLYFQCNKCGKMISID